MKKLLTLTGIASIGAVLALLAACQTTGTGQAAASQKESLLSQSGFKVITVTTPKQLWLMESAAVSRRFCSAGWRLTFSSTKLYYVFPTATKDKIYVGKQKQFNAYKTALAAQQGSQQAQPGQQQINPPPTFTYEGAGPHHVEVEQFDGFGPMGTAS